MEIVIVLLLVANLAATTFLVKKLAKPEPITVEFIPFTEPELEIVEKELAQTLPEPESVSPEPSTANKSYDPWQTRKNIPWNEAAAPPPPPAKKQPGERPYGWV